MKAPKPPKEDPAVAAARESERVRANAERLKQTQAQLAEETRLGAIGLNSRGLVQVTGSGLRSRLGAG